jgi:hypothetical protein
MPISPTLTLTVDKTVASPGENVTLSGVLNIPNEAGDIVKDNIISLADVVALAKSYGSYPGHARWNPDADLNKDGKVDLGDLVIIAKHYGQHSGDKTIILYVSSDGATWTQIAQITTARGTVMGPPYGSFTYNYTIPTDTPVPSTLYFMAYFPGGIF